jgi:putative addiction module component (TIGR02574 family)
MAISTEELLSLPTEEKLRIMELLWDHMSETQVPISIFQADRDETVRRLNPLKNDPQSGHSHEEVWKRIWNR